MCEECVQAKQHRNSFSKDAGSKTKAILEVVYVEVKTVLMNVLMTTNHMK